MRRPGFLGALLVAFLAGAPHVRAQPPLWSVTTPTAHLVLFGSVHLLPGGVDWAPPGLERALAQADELWFELPLDDATDSQALALARGRGLLPPGDSLFDHLSQGENGRLRAACTVLQIACSALAPARPWLADVTLSLLEDARAGAKTSQGVEQILAAEAPARVRRRAFETPADQVEVLAGAALRDQIASLDETASEIIDDPGYYPRLVGEWESGDLAAVTRDALEPLSRTSPALFDRLITQRNRRWTDILSRRLKGRGDIVVVVGMGHLVGPGGVPALLRARGFRVDGP